MLPLLGAKKKLSSHEMEIFLTPDEEKWADEFLAKYKLAGQKILGIHVGSGGTKNLPLKRWPLKNYIGLVRRLNRNGRTSASCCSAGRRKPRIIRWCWRRRTAI